MLDSSAGEAAEPDMSGDSDKTKGATTPGSTTTAGSNTEGAPPSGPTEGKSEAEGAAKPKAAKPRKKAAQSKSSKKRKTRAKPSPRPKSPATTGPADDKPRAATATQDSANKEASAVKPSDRPGPAGKGTAKGRAGEGVAPDASGSAAALPQLAAGAADERGETVSKASESPGSHWAWGLLLLFLAMGGLGYWLWQEQGPRLLQIAGLTRSPAELEEAQDVQPAAGSESQPMARTEEVELPTPPAMPLAQIAELEALLARLGLDPGEVDGIVDDKTRQAISEFQKLDETEVDGEPSEDLLAALREVAGFQGGG